MKHIFLKRTIFVLLLVVTFNSVLTAQNKSVALRSDSTTAKPASNVYFELFGNGIIYSLNYDTRFSKRHDGLGGRVGIGFFAQNGDNFFSAPVVLNYLAGKKGKYFEVGAGISYYSVKTSGSFIFVDNNNPGGSYNNSNSSSLNGVYGTMTFGYRSQPEDGGFCFRAGVSPIITSNSFAPYWPYFSFGYTF